MNTKTIYKFFDASQSMIKTLSLAILALGSVACGRHEAVLNVDSEFAPYVTRFEQTAATQGIHLQVDNLSIQFGDLPNPRENGVCEIAPNTTPSITIRKTIWDRMSDADREELVFHEMGHCVLGRVHKADKNSLGVPESMMNPYRIAGVVYEQHHDDYIAELFHPDSATSLAAQ